MDEPKHAKFPSKLLCTTVLCGMVAAYPAWGNPEGGSVAAGSASISSSGSTVTIDQTSSKAILNWNSFDIAPGETTQFVQPSASAVAASRISENKPSAIDGSLLANGNVILINPNGIVFGKTSQVNVGSLIVSTSDVDDNAFMTQSNPVFGKPGSSHAARSYGRAASRRRRPRVWWDLDCAF